MFISTKDTTGENRKAIIKNYNLPILQEIYMGDSSKPLACCISGAAAFESWPCLVKGCDKIRFTIDFNHVRQCQTGNAAGGTSLDKSKYPPSGIFREKRLDQSGSLLDLIEFLTIMPVNALVHEYITQDSQLDHITLTNFDPKWWPWHLKSKANWDFLAAKYNFTFISYDQIIDHLSCIDHPPIRNRISKQWVKGDTIWTSGNVYCFN